MRACGRSGRAGAFDGEARVGKISQRRAENLIKIGIFMETKSLPVSKSVKRGMNLARKALEN